MKKLFLIIVLIAVIGITGCSKTPQPVAENNNNTSPAVVDTSSKAIDFELMALNGDKVKLSDLKGKVVVLNFFATWCPPCKLEMPDFVATMREMKDNSNIKFIFVDAGEDKSDISKFLKANKYEIMNPLLDDKGDVMNAYGVNGIPSTFIIDKNGNIKFHREGYLDLATLKKAIKEILD